jgi:high-affinity Fe2+/Pb2+ permease
MLYWLVDQILDVVNFVPALFVEQDSPRFEMVRGLFGLMFVLLVLLALALWPKRSNTMRGRTRDKG